MDNPEGMARVGSRVSEHQLIAETAIAHGAVQKPNELAEFLDMLTVLEPEVIVEIGVFSGGTLYAWSRFAPTVIGIDLVPGGKEPIYASNGKPRNEHGATVIVGDSHDEATRDALLDFLDGRMVDLLFIDGDHAYEGVRRDYELYSPLVRPGGVIAFHDIVPHFTPSIGVDKLWRDIRDKSAIEIVEPSRNPWGGIGALRVSMCSPYVIDFVKRELTADEVKGASVLEVGSYDVNGSTRPYIESLGPSKYVGVDAQPGPGVDLVMDCENLTELGGEWDIVISTEMLEHVRDWQTCMEQLALITGDLLLITTRSPGFGFHPFPEDHWRFTIDEMQQIIDALALGPCLIEDDPGPGCQGVFALAQKPRNWYLPDDFRDRCPVIPEGRFVQ